MSPEWAFSDPRTRLEHLGLLPLMISESNPAPAREQLDTMYLHGGGFSPFKGFTLTDEGLEYPGDRPLREIARCALRDESVRLYELSWVAIVQLDGSYVVARMD